MQLSVRGEKVRGKSLSRRQNHNSRKTISSSVDTKKSEKNVHFQSEHHQDELENLWKTIRADFDSKKKSNIIPPKTRFLKRTSTKNYKDINGIKKQEQIETSICREFSIQIGKGEDHLSEAQSFEIYKKAMDWINQNYKLTVLNYDFHVDETTPHLHFISTTYDFNTGIFSKKFNTPDSYSKMQEKLFEYISTLIDIEKYSRKKCSMPDYVPPTVYKRNKEMLDKAQKFCETQEKREKHLEIYKKSQKSTDKRLASACEEISTLKEALEDTKPLQDELDHTKSALKASEALKMTQNNKIQELKTTNEHLKAENTSIAKQKSEAINKLNVLVGTYKDFKAQVSVLEKELRTYRGTNRQEHRTELQEMKFENRALEEELKKARREIDTLKALPVAVESLSEEDALFELRNLTNKKEPLTPIEKKRDQTLRNYIFGDSNSSVDEEAIFYAPEW